MKYSIEPTVKIRRKAVNESYYDMSTLSDVFERLNISKDLGLEMIDKYFSAKELNMLYDWLYADLDADGAFESCKLVKADTASKLNEDADMSPENLISKVNDNDLKNIVKSAGVKLNGNETKDEIVGMAKVLASQNESVKRRIHRVCKFESTKLKRKKGIPHSKITETECKHVSSKFLK